MSESILFPPSEHDSDLLIVNNAGFFGMQCNVTTVTNTDSPYTIVEEDYGIFIDASAGPVEVILEVDNVNKPNRGIILKKVDSTTNTITITPAAGDTVVGLANIGLVRENEVLHLCRCDDINNWVITNDRPDRLMTTPGDIFVRGPDGLVTKPAGMDGYILISDSTQTDGLRWAMPSTIQFNPTYHLSTVEMVTRGPTWYTIAKFPWKNSRYSGFGPGRVIFHATTFNRDLTVRVVDVVAGNTVIGSSAVIPFPSSGSFEFAITNPTADTYLNIQIYSNSQGGFQSRIFGMHIEFGF